MAAPTNGPWDLPIRDFEVLTVTFAFSIVVVAYGDGGCTATISFHGAFSLLEADGRIHDLDAEHQSWPDLAVVLGLRHDKIASATVSEEARLEIKLNSGRVLRAEADETPYEHWDVSGPGFRLIARPGQDADGVAVYDD